jgi:cytochrome c
MKPFAVLIAVSLSLGAASAYASPELATKSKCMTCHDVAKKKMGPSFKDISTKYKGQAGAEAMLADGIVKGSKGKWGKIPMPPQKVAPADAQTLAKWMLTL